MVFQKFIITILVWILLAKRLLFLFLDMKVADLFEVCNMGTKIERKSNIVSREGPTDVEECRADGLRSLPGQRKVQRRQT